MLCYEYPLHWVADGSSGYQRSETGAVIESHKLLDSLQEDEYFTEGPSLPNGESSAVRFFHRFEGPTFEERLRLFDHEEEIQKIPKAYDVALATASAELPEASRLLRDLLKQGIAHDPVGECLWFFENFDERLDAFERLAELDAERVEQRRYDQLVRGDE